MGTTSTPAGTDFRQDVFISYSKADKEVADQILAALESRSLKCWIAPRDVPPGETWAASIISAIDGSRVMVLILSPMSDRSRQVIREVERAVAKGLVLIPVRLQDFTMSAEMEYFLSSTHWIDASDTPLSDVQRRLGDVLSAIKSSRLESPLPTIPRRRRFVRRYLAFTAWMLLSAAAGVATGIWYATPPAATADPARTELARSERIRSVLLQHLVTDGDMVVRPTATVLEGKLVLTGAYEDHEAAQVLLSRLAGGEQTIRPAWALRSVNASRTLNALDQQTEVEFPDNTFKEVIDYLRQIHNIPIMLDLAAIQDAGINVDEEKVSLTLSGIPLRTALHVICDLETMKLRYSVEELGLIITTPENIRLHQMTATYDISPIIHSGSPLPSPNSAEAGDRSIPDIPASGVQKQPGQPSDRNLPSPRPPGP